MIHLLAVSALTLIGARQQNVPTRAVILHEQLACAPASLPTPPLAGIRIVGGYEPGRMMFGPGDPIVIDAGSSQGVMPGQMFFVRRALRDHYTLASVDFRPHPVHTTGWVTVQTVAEHTAIARVTHACDGMLLGDYLEPYVDPPDPPNALQGAPDFEHPGRIVMADEERQMGSEGSLMLIDRGADHEVRAGQTLTIYRQTLGGVGPTFIVGSATVLSVRPQTSLVRIENTHDAVYLGDLVAINRMTPTPQSGG
jgi:hypothetical protein